MNKNLDMFSYVFKSCIGFMLSNNLNAKKKKNTFGIRNTQYRIALSVHKQPSAFNTIYTIQSRVNCPNSEGRPAKYYTRDAGGFNY